MKSIFYKTASLLGLFTALACSESSPYTTIDITGVKTTSLTTEKVPLNESPLYPKGCWASDTLLVVYEEQQDENFIKLYNLKTNDLLKETGYIGNGRCEFAEPRFLAGTTATDNSWHFLLGDTKNLYNLSIDSLLVGYKQCENSIVTAIPDVLKGYNYLLQNTDTLIVGNTMTNQLVFFNKKTQKAANKNYYPAENPKNLSDFQLQNLYTAAYAAKQDTIAIAYNNFKQIDFVTSNGNCFKRVVFPDFDKNTAKVKKIDDVNIKIDDGDMYYTYLYATPTALYALCWDGKTKEVGQGKVVPQIHVFSWQGVLKEIITPDVPISYFCIDSKTNTLYAVAMNLEAFELEIRKGQL